MKRGIGKGVRIGGAIQKNWGNRVTLRYVYLQFIFPSLFIVVFDPTSLKRRVEPVNSSPPINIFYVASKEGRNLSGSMV